MPKDARRSARYLQNPQVAQPLGVTPSPEHWVGSIAQIVHDSATTISVQSSVPLMTQSPGQFVVVSPPAESHTVSPQIGPAAGQSAGQLAVVSGGSHVPLLHTGAVLPPQSCVHLPTSEGAHVPSPHTGATDAASGMGSSSPEPSELGPHAPKPTAQTNASVVLIGAHRTSRRNQIKRNCNHPASAP